jgi:hypothetical protein
LSRPVIACNPLLADTSADPQNLDFSRDRKAAAFFSGIVYINKQPVALLASRKFALDGVHASAYGNSPWSKIAPEGNFERYACGASGAWPRSAMS